MNILIRLIISIALTISLASSCTVASACKDELDRLTVNAEPNPSYELTPLVKRALAARMRDGEFCCPGPCCPDGHNLAFPFVDTLTIPGVDPASIPKTK